MSKTATAAKGYRFTEPRLLAWTWARCSNSGALRWLSTARLPVLPIGRAGLLVLMLAGLLSLGRTNEVYYFSLTGEGTACLVLSRNTQTAWLLDGGKEGSLRGEKLVLHNQDVLAFLKQAQVARVVINCSHPHSDHLDGLIELVTRKAAKPAEVDLTAFDHVKFVDGGYPAGKDLHSLFLNVHPEAAEKSTHREAPNELGAVVWDPDPKASGRVDAQVEYFRSKRAGSTPHGDAFIRHITLTKEGSPETTLLVDFDDADSQLVVEWGGWANAHAPKVSHRIYVAPHHNSDLTDIGPLLEKELLPETVIVPANSGNRFGHPGPKNWLRWMESLGGPEHVHVTGAGSGILVTEKGLATASSAEMANMVSLIVEPQLRRTEMRLRAVEESVNADFGQKQLPAMRVEEGLSREELGQRVGVSGMTVWAWEERVLPVPSGMEAELVKKRTEKLQGDLQALTQIKDKLLEHQGKRQEPIVDLASLKAHLPDRTQPTALNREWPEWPFGGGPSGESPGGSGAPRPEPIKPSPKGPSLAGVGPYKERIGEFESAPRRFSVEPLPAGRVGRFGLALRGRPIFGGIVMGNACSAEGFRPISSTLVRREDGEFELDIMVEESSGEKRVVTYDAFTPTELWCAYRIASPMPGWAGEYGVSSNECNLVGISTNYHVGWSFAVHPALANTLVGRDLMAQDMLLSGLSDLLASKLPQYETYRWFDRRSKIVMKNGGSLEVVPVEGDGPSILGFTLWSTAKPVKEYMDALAPYRPLFEEYEEGVKKLKSQSGSGGNSSLRETIPTSDSDMTEAEVSKLEARLIEIQNTLKVAEPKLKQLRERLENFDGTVSFNEQPLVSALYTKLPLVRRVDRFARLLALMNWLSESTPSALPMLDEVALKPMWVDIPAALSWQDWYKLAQAEDGFGTELPNGQVLASSVSVGSFLIDFWLGRLLLVFGIAALLGMLFLRKRIRKRSVTATA